MDTTSAIQDTRKEKPMLIFTEIIRWVIVIVPTFLSVWRYAEHVGYTIFISDIDKNNKSEVQLQFWVITSSIILGVSLLVYLPLKLLYIRFWYVRGTTARERFGVRSSLLFYIFLCALPCFILILIAAGKHARQVRDYINQGNITISVHDYDDLILHPTTIAVLQGLVMGLTFTEWMAKLREEELTYDLISLMAVDFFFAYDVIELIMMATTEIDVYTSNWLYVSFVFAFLAMFKYVPACPTTINPKTSAPKGMGIFLLVSMFTNDIPFVIIRLTTMINFDYPYSDLIHPAKNIAMIFFNSTQLYIITRNLRSYNQEEALRFAEHRVDRCDCKLNTSKVSCCEEEAGEQQQQQQSGTDQKGVVTVMSKEVVTVMKHGAGPSQKTDNIPSLPEPEPTDNYTKY